MMLAWVLAGKRVHKPEVHRQQSQQQSVCFTGHLRCEAGQERALQAEKLRQHLPPCGHQCCAAGAARRGRCSPCPASQQAGGDPSDYHLQSGMAPYTFCTLAALFPKSFPIPLTLGHCWRHKNELQHLCRGLKTCSWYLTNALWVLSLQTPATGCPCPGITAVPCPLWVLS